MPQVAPLTVIPPLLIIIGVIVAVVVVIRTLQRIANAQEATARSLVEILKRLESRE